jgi:acyl-CoA thioesterase-1
MVSAELSASEEEEMRVSMVRSYGNSVRAVERRYGLFMHIAVLMFALMTVANPAWAEAAKPIKLVVLGDSLSAGLGLPAQEAFPTKLQKALQDKGIEVGMTNAGVSGDTSSGGRDRLDWSVPDGTDGVIIELGANDALRGIDPDLTRTALTEIVQRLKARKIAVMLCGMLAPPNYGADYAARFNSIYPDLAKKFGVPLYPFFLDGVAADAKLNQADGIHPTAAGVDIIVKNILPTVEAFLGTIAEQRR